MFERCERDGAVPLMMAAVFLSYRERPTYIVCQHSPHEQIDHFASEPENAPGERYPAWATVEETGFVDDADWERHVRARCARHRGQTVAIVRANVPRRHSVAQCAIAPDSFVEYYSVR